MADMVPGSFWILQ